jgi:putative Mn2+ efflux pump MntP
MTSRNQWIAFFLLSSWGVFCIYQGVKAHNYMKMAGLIDQAENECYEMVNEIEDLHEKYTRKTFEVFSNTGIDYEG